MSKTDKKLIMENLLVVAFFVLASFCYYLKTDNHVIALAAPFFLSILGLPVLWFSQVCRFYKPNKSKY